MHDTKRCLQVPLNELCELHCVKNKKKSQKQQTGAPHEEGTFGNSNSETQVRGAWLRWTDVCAEVKPPSTHQIYRLLMKRTPIPNITEEDVQACITPL